VHQTLHTERLTLRPTSTGDADDFFAFMSDRRTMRFMPWLPHSSVDETREWLAADLARPGERYWSIALRDQDTVFGCVNFLGAARFPGMGYMLHPDYWGHGYASEACRAVLDAGFRLLSYDRVELWIDERNAASLGVARKLGFRPKGRIPWKFGHQTTQHMMMVYGMLATEWQARPGDRTPAEQSVDHTAFYGVQPVLVVADVAKTVSYYRDKLRFGVDFLYGDPPVHAAVSRGEWTGSVATIQFSRGEPDQTLAPTGYLYVLIDTHLDALCDQYQELGVEILSRPEDKPWGMREFSIRDCNGHTLVFATQS
jgi:ribosomal-protein-alanine N-acetyltransferase